MILRTSYFNQLLQLRDQDLIKVVTGIRRCGKSTLLHAFKQHLVTDGVAADAICALIRGFAVTKSNDVKNRLPADF